MSKRSPGQAWYARMLRDPRWREFRQEIMELDGGRCMRCGLGRQHGKAMHVHHREYRAGLMPWEYPYGLLETLCAGCHAREHGILIPVEGWTLVDWHDEGELNELCNAPSTTRPGEPCEEPIRYVFTVWHPSWGMMDVGTVCCDRLTGTAHASELVKQISRKDRFIQSSRWRKREKSQRIRQGKIDVYVLAWGDAYRIRMRKCGAASVLGARSYGSEEQAKAAAFEAIESGEAARFLERASAQ